MNLSIEVKVAAFVASGFMALAVGVIAKGNSGEQNPGPNGSELINRPEINMQISRHVDNKSPSGPLKATFAGDGERDVVANWR